jgi:hypothetical protein
MILFLCYQQFALRKMHIMFGSHTHCPCSFDLSGEGGLLPSLGIVLQEERLPAACRVLAIPSLLSHGVKIPQDRAENWAPVLSRANFNVNPKSSIVYNVVVVHHGRLSSAAETVYQKIRDLVNRSNARYRFGLQPLALVNAGDKDRSHWGAVEKYFSGRVKENIFVLDFVKPSQGQLDPAYPVVKRLLASNGYLSQFVNFVTFSHDNPRADERRSSMILQGVARQILQKSGVQLWLVKFVVVLLLRREC